MALADKLGLMFRVTLLIALLYSIFFKSTENPALENLNFEKMKLIEKEGKLLEKGILKESGYSFQYLKTFTKQDVYPAIFGIKGFYSDIRLKGCDEVLVFGDKKGYQINFCDQRYSQKVNVNVFNYEEKELESESLSLNYLFNKDQFFEFQFENGFVCGQNYQVKNQNNEFLMKTTLTQNECKFDLELKSKNLNEKISITKNLSQQQLYEMNTISEDKSHWVYQSYSMNNNCQLQNSKNCQAIIKVQRANYFYNTYMINFEASGQTKQGDKISIIFQQGLVNENTESMPHAVMLNEKIVKLEPLKLKFDRLNMNNGMEFQTYKKHKNGKRQAWFVFSTLGTKNINQNYFFIQNFTDIVFGEVTGFVIDEEGQKIEFENIKGIFRQSFLRG